jgi:hypothetical protein
VSKQRTSPEMAMKKTISSPLCQEGSSFSFLKKEKFERKPSSHLATKTARRATVHHRKMTKVFHRLHRFLE